MRNVRGLSIFALSGALVAAGCSGGAGSSSGSGAMPQLSGVSRASGTSTQVQHVIIMVQENRSFDDFFATFPGAVGATSGLERQPSGPDKVIQLKAAALDSDSLGHEHFTFQKEYDNGKMDGFNHVDRTIVRGEKVPAGTYAYRYVKPSEIKEYWNIAGQYVLGDHMFTTQSSSSFTAHQDLITGGTPSATAATSSTSLLRRPGAAMRRRER